MEHISLRYFLHLERPFLHVDGNHFKYVDVRLHMSTVRVPLTQDITAKMQEIATSQEWTSLGRQLNGQP